MRSGSAFVIDWRDAVQLGPDVAGGKGWNLGRLHRYGFRVPEGGVVTAAVYDAVMSDPDIRILRKQLATVAAGEVAGEAVAEQLGRMRELILEAPFPEGFLDELHGFLVARDLADSFVAVRSSATAEDSMTASFAGIHESFLNVKGLYPIMAAIKGCYASLWTPKALAYRRRFGFDDDQVRCAVVLCEMVGPVGSEGATPVCAGVAFSCDPLNGDRERIVISAVPGLGESLVAGAANPEELYIKVLPTGECSLIKRRSSEEPVMSDEAALALARQVQRVLWALGDGQDPQDVEWAYDGKELWLLQARPVTVLPRNVPEGAKALPVIWSNANLKDSVPIVLSTYGWALIRQIISVNLFAPHEASGYAVPSGMERMRRFAGRPYFDLTLMAWIYYDSLAVPPADLNRSLGGYQPEIPVPRSHPLSCAHLRRSVTRMRLWRVMRRFDRSVEETIRHATQVVERLSQVDLPELSDRELATHLHNAAAEGVAFAPATMYANASAGVWLQILETLLDRLAKGRGRALTSGLMAGRGGVVSAEHSLRLVELARAAKSDNAARMWLQQVPLDPLGWQKLPADSPFRSAFEAFLREFGHRGVYEVDVMNPRWREDPSYLLEQIRYILAGDVSRDPRREAEQKRQAAEAEVASHTRLLQSLIRWLAGRLQRAFALREVCKSSLVAFLTPLRLGLLEAGRRLADRGLLDDAEEIFFLSPIDVEMVLLGEWDGAGIRELVSDRKRQYQNWQAQVPPDVLIEERGILRPWNGETLSAAKAKHETAERLASGPNGQTLIGVAVSSGKAQGRVRVLTHPGEGSRLAGGEVLVAPSTDPGWTPLFLRAAALVMEVGGYQSHGAIVSREYGLPAVANIPGLLQLVRDGDVVAVDGDLGTVTVLRRAPEVDESR